MDKRPARPSANDNDEDWPLVKEFLQTLREAQESRDKRISALEERLLDRLLILLLGWNTFTEQELVFRGSLAYEDATTLGKSKYLPILRSKFNQNLLRQVQKAAEKRKAQRNASGGGCGD